MKKTAATYLWIVGAICVAAILAAAFCLPGARLSFLLLAAFIGGSIAVGAYSQCRFRTPAGMAIIMAGYTLVVVGIIWNINYYTEVLGGTYFNPVLENTDHRTDWLWARHWLDGRPIVEADNVMGIRYLSYAAAALMWLFGRDIGVPLMLNAFCYPLAITLIGAITFQISESKKVATIGMAVASLMCYFMAEATVLLKDVPLTMCIAAVVWVVVKWSKPTNAISAKDIVLVALALIGAGFLRANIMAMLSIGCIIYAVRNRERRRAFCWLAIGCAAVFAVMHTFFSFPNIAVQSNIHYDNGVFVHNQQVMAYDNIIEEEYFKMPVWKRLLWLPASVVVQFLIPFPWNFARDMIFGPFMVVAHISYFWYYAGAVLIFWIFAKSRRSPKTLQNLVVWGVILTIITAYVTNGRVSRYCLVYLPMLLPAVAITINNCLRERKFWIWLGIFTLILVPTLIVCHHLQMSAA